MRNSLRLLTYICISGLLFMWSCGTDETEYGDWIQGEPFTGSTRSDASSFSIGEKGYVVGGTTGKYLLTDLYEFDATIDSWKDRKAFPGTPRSNATAFSLDGKGYYGTGYDGDLYLNDFWMYNPGDDSWTQIADFGGSARTGALSFGIDGKGYVGCGFDDSYQKDLWVYTPGDNTWEKLDVGVKGSKRNNGTAFVYKGKAYVVGGEWNGLYVTDFYSFDPDTQSWTELREITNESDDDYDDDYDIARAYGLIMLIGDRIFFTSGESGSLRTDIWEYLPDDDLWEEGSKFEGTARTAAVGIHSSDRAFILTGRSGSSYHFEDMWEYLPDVEYDEDHN